MNGTNNKLASRIVLYGLTRKRVAAEMGINARVFNNKLHRRIVNGYVSHFNHEQKEWLANRFDMEIEDIE